MSSDDDYDLEPNFEFLEKEYGCFSYRGKKYARYEPINGQFEEYFIVTFIDEELFFYDFKFSWGIDDEGDKFCDLNEKNIIQIHGRQKGDKE